MTPTKKPPPLGEKWRRTKVKAELIDSEIKQLPFVDLSPRELFLAQNNWDRSFDDGTPPGKSRKFKFTTNHWNEFGATPHSLLSKAGYVSMMNKYRENLNYSQSYIDEQKHFRDNKRKILEEREHQVWNSWLKTPEVFLHFPLDKQRLPRNLFRENKKLADL